MAVGDLLGGALAATPYGAAATAISGIASGVAGALTAPPPPPDYSTKASNKKRDQFLINTIAPSLSLQITTGGTAGGLSSALSPSAELSAATTQRAEATGGQGNTSPIGGGGIADTISALTADPVTLAGVGAVILLAVFLIFRRR